MQGINDRKVGIHDFIGRYKNRSLQETMMEVGTNTNPR